MRANHPEISVCGYGISHLGRKYLLKVVFHSLWEMFRNTLVLDILHFCSCQSLVYKEEGNHMKTAICG